MTIIYEPDRNRFTMHTDAGDAYVDIRWDGDVMVLDKENPEGNGHCVNSKMAKRMVAAAGLLGPRHVCDESCK